MTSLTECSFQRNSFSRRLDRTSENSLSRLGILFIALASFSFLPLYR